MRLWRPLWALFLLPLGIWSHQNGINWYMMMPFLLSHRRPLSIDITFAHSLEGVHINQNGAIGI
jgi:hypothetical protein